MHTHANSHAHVVCLSPVFEGFIEWLKMRKTSHAFSLTSTEPKPDPAPRESDVAVASPRVVPPHLRDDDVDSAHTSDDVDVEADVETPPPPPAPPRSVAPTPPQRT